MLKNPGNYVIIGQNPKDGRFWIHERENKNNKPGKVVTFIDGKGDVKNTIKNYIEKGYNSNKIIYNGQPITDVFEKQK